MTESAHKDRSTRPGVRVFTGAVQKKTRQKERAKKRVKEIKKLSQSQAVRD